MVKYCKITEENFFLELKKLKIDLDIPFIKKIFDFAKKAHKGQKRSSGEPYIIHPLSTAYILAKMHMSSKIIATGILHDVIEDTEFTFQDLKNLFGENIANLVEGVTKISDFHYKGSSHMAKQAENFRKLLISSTKDVRVILIKLADRLHNMQTIEFLDTNRQKRIAKSTLSIYAPLANRFGLAKIKNELEDRCLKVLSPEDYKNIASLINQKKDERDNFLKKQVIEKLEAQLLRNNIGAKVVGRNKHFYSIYRKHTVRDVPYSEILDLHAIRILVNSTEECYNSLGILHGFYKPLNIVKDYLANPKPNGYKSLHTIVIGPMGKNMEVQIRTHQMDRYAQEGIASHWRYKEQTNYSKENLVRAASKGVDLQFEKQVNFVRDFLQNNTNKNADDFLGNLQLDLYPDIIIVRTPEGDLLDLPRESSVIDFAFHIHTQVGSCCHACKINGVIKPIKSVLKTGDRVEIVTGNRQNISKDWLKYVKTSKARSKIKSYLKKMQIEDALNLGKEIFTKKTRKFHLKFKSTDKILSLAKKFHINNLQDFYASIGQGNIIFPEILEKISKKKEQKKPKYELTNEKKSSTLIKDIKGVRVDGQSNLMIRYAGCCHPLPGDDIIGFTTRGRGIVIHQKSCQEPNFLEFLKNESERFISVDWDYTSKNKSTKGQHILIIAFCKNNPHVLIDILSILAKNEISVEKTDSKMMKNHNLKITIGFYLKKTEKTQIIINSIKNIRQVLSVQRKTKKRKKTNQLSIDKLL